MAYELSWLATLIVVIVSVVLGSAAALALPRGPLRFVWALLVALVFIVAGSAAIILGYSWMFADRSREIAQIVAIGAGLTGLVYTARATN